MNKLFLFLALVLLLIGCDFVDGVAEAYKEITTELLDSHTMEPLNKYWTRYKLDIEDKDLKRFDVIMFEYQDEFFDASDFYSDDRHVSRLIGFPQEDIEIRKGWVYINGKKLEEPFLQDSLRSDDDMSLLHLEKGNYFVMVDCRKMALEDSVLEVAYKAYDSRKIGTIHYRDIVGKTNLK